jgi:hypothetical protein
MGKFEEIAKEELNSACPSQKMTRSPKEPLRVLIHQEKEKALYEF